jgi:hypothetical protein
MQSHKSLSPKKNKGLRAEWLDSSLRWPSLLVGLLLQVDQLAASVKNMCHSSTSEKTATNQLDHAT